MRQRRTSGIPRPSAVPIERLLSGEPARHYKLRLYIAGNNLNSFLAIQNVERLCQQHLRGRADLEIIDLYQQPALAREDRIVAAPCLIKRHPLPQRMFIGDMSNLDRVVRGLGIRIGQSAGDGDGSKEKDCPS